MDTDNIYQVIVDSLSTHVAVLDEHGVIIETNHAWREFGKANGLKAPLSSVGLNYLNICESASEEDQESDYIASAIRLVINGELQEFLTQYPCHSPTEKRWYNLRVVPYRSTTENRVIVTHENITPIILAQEKLRIQDEELQTKTAKLEESNIALKVLLEHRERDKTELEHRFVANINELVLPYLDRLEQSPLAAREKTLVNIATHHLQDVISPFLQRLSTMNLLLTPQEVEVATMVRQGKSSQEIADVLNVSVATVSFHRKKLRQKLGLTKTGTNLRTYLLSLQ